LRARRRRGPPEPLRRPAAGHHIGGLARPRRVPDRARWTGWPPRGALAYAVSPLWSSSTVRRPRRDRRPARRPRRRLGGGKSALSESGVQRVSRGADGTDGITLARATGADPAYREGDP